MIVGVCVGAIWYSKVVESLRTKVDAGVISANDYLQGRDKSEGEKQNFEKLERHCVSSRSMQGWLRT